MRRGTSQEYDRLPPQTVRQLRGVARAGLREWAKQSDQSLVEAKLEGCTDKVSVLREIARAFNLPAWFGLNLDALYDSLTDLPAQQPSAGYLVVLERLPHTEKFGDAERGALLEVFRDAAESFAEQGIPFRVFYS
jgi:RNAse (barnase) inhibitor barstar